MLFQFKTCIILKATQSQTNAWVLFGMAGTKVELRNEFKKHFSQHYLLKLVESVTYQPLPKVIANLGRWGLATIINGL